MRLSHEIVLASLNADKLREFKALFSSYPEVKIIQAEGLLRNVEKLALVETFKTYAENAIAKARLANLGCHYPTLADDSGLEVMGLDGRPGVESHRFAQPQSGGFSFTKTQQNKANVDLLLQQLQGQPANGRKARFVCTLALCLEGILITATGTLEGTIAEQPRGQNGFGYDPVFIPEGSTKTFAEMTDAEKNMISHRAKAVHQLMAQAKTRGIVFTKP